MITPTVQPGVRLLNAEDRAWDEQLALVPHSVFHTAGYHRYTHGFGLGEPFLAVVGDEARGLVWPYLLRTIDQQGPTTYTDVHSAYGYPGPLAWGCSTDDEFLRRALDAVTRQWQAQGAISAFTRFNPLLANAWVVSASGGVIGSSGVVSTGQTVSVDLEMDQASVRRGYARTLLQDISKGRRSGLRTVHDVQWSHISSFADLYTRSMNRLGAVGFYYFDEADYIRLRAQLPDRVHLLVTLMGEDVAAAGLLLDAGDVIEYHLVGSDDAFRELSPSKVLVDDAIQWARDRGFRVLHMGGGRGAREDSLFWFKSRFSKRRHPFSVGRWILASEPYAELTSQRRATLQAGEHLDETFFPAYRAPVVPPQTTRPQALLS